MSTNIIRQQLALIGYTIESSTNGPENMEWSEWPCMSGLSALQSRRVFDVMESLNWVVGFPNNGWIEYKLTHVGADCLNRLTSAGAGAVPVDLAEAQIKILSAIIGDAVFIVHSDHPERLDFARDVQVFVNEVIGTEAILLKPAIGKSLWDEFEKQASGCRVAVCIWSKDRDNPDSRHIRPNVLLETGYFLSRLGHGKVIIIREDDDLNAPSDLAGIVWANKSNWREQLPPALREALTEPPQELPPNNVPSEQASPPQIETESPASRGRYTDTGLSSFDVGLSGARMRRLNRRPETPLDAEKPDDLPF